jgi:hypothetical protein
MPLPATFECAVLHRIEAIAAETSLRDTSSYGSGIRKFHIFCDIYNVPEDKRLPASFQVLNSFALWVVTDPILEPHLQDKVPFEQVSVVTAHKYLAAVRACLSEEMLTRINWSLRGLANVQGTF